MQEEPRGFEVTRRTATGDHENAENVSSLLAFSSHFQTAHSRTGHSCCQPDESATL